MNFFELLPSIINSEKIVKENYAVLPADVLQIAQNYPYVHKVTVIPQKKLTERKTANMGLCKTRILTPASFSTPGIVPINKGRIPAENPAANVDDMRPCLFYILGSGKQKFRTNLQTNNNIYVEQVLTF